MKGFWFNIMFNIYKNHGMTLIELMITLIIAAILLTTAIPSFSEMIQRNKISKTSNSLSRAISFAKSEAIRTGMMIDICASNDHETCIGSAKNSDWSNGWIVLSMNEVLKVGYGIDKLNFTASAATDSAKITFDHLGMASNQVVFSVAGSSCISKKYTLLMQATGRLKLTKEYC